MYISNKYYLLPIFIFSHYANAIQYGDICHVVADYYWGGVWVSYSDNQLICDYWTINNLVFDSNEEINEEQYNTDNTTFDEETNAYGNKSAPSAEDLETEADEE
ncbi:hypothetical protein [Caviibacterium pharyngocola]|uniref:Uncharacterized protein n=1 Tax=Caviibacterium pharyngocola TaxID=28159 RepID=A0A2M8RV80_9PAST|nr:hypothetical protein [Caviibacterium pharyngocola]PJG82798.1 hypothetical protein CVP04_07495 [Caviibacterium pharyngocola]